MKLTGIIFLLFVLVACKPKPQGPPSYFCRPELETFFAGPDSLPVIEFKHTDSFEMIEKLLKNINAFRDLKADFKITFPIDSVHSIPLKIFIVRERFGCGPRYGVLVKVNSVGQFLAGFKIGDTSDVRQNVSEELSQYWYNEPYHSNRISVNYGWDYGINSNLFQSGLKAIINGYTDAVNRYSIKKYNTDFCKLDTVRTDSLLNLIQFNLEFLYHETIPEPQLRIILD